VDLSNPAFLKPFDYGMYYITYIFKVMST
jgi:hypothetical protein